MRMELNLIVNFCLGSVNFSFFQHRGTLNLVIWNFLSLKSLRIGEFKWNLWWMCTVLWSNACVCRIGFMLVGVLIVYWHFHGDPFWQVIPSLHCKCSQMICIVKACMKWWNSLQVLHLQTNFFSICGNKEEMSSVRLVGTLYFGWPTNTCKVSVVIGSHRKYGVLLWHGLWQDLQVSLWP